LGWLYIRKKLVLCDFLLVLCDFFWIRLSHVSGQILHSGTSPAPAFALLRRTSLLLKSGLPAEALAKAGSGRATGPKERHKG
jgi:hypothetical protein